MIGDINTIVHQFGTDILIKEFEIDTLLQGLVTGRIEDIIYNFIEQCFLIDIAVTNDLLK